MAGFDLIGANLGRFFNVTPAKAGVQRLSKTRAVERLDPRFRGDDKASARLLGQVSAHGARPGHAGNGGGIVLERGTDLAVELLASPLFQTRTAVNDAPFGRAAGGGRRRRSLTAVLVWKFHNQELDGEVRSAAGGIGRVSRRSQSLPETAGRRGRRDLELGIHASVAVMPLHGIKYASVSAPSYPMTVFNGYRALSVGL